MNLFGGGGNSSAKNHPLAGTEYQGSVVKKVKEKQEEKPNGRIKISQEIHLHNGCIFLESRWLSKDELYPPPPVERQPRPFPMGSSSTRKATSAGNNSIASPPRRDIPPKEQASVATASTGYDSGSSNQSLPSTLDTKQEQPVSSPTKKEATPAEMNGSTRSLPRPPSLVPPPLAQSPAQVVASPAASSTPKTKKGKGTPSSAISTRKKMDKGKTELPPLPTTTGSTSKIKPKSFKKSKKTVAAEGSSSSNHLSVSSSSLSSVGSNETDNQQQQQLQDVRVSQKTSLGSAPSTRSQKRGSNHSSERSHRAVTGSHKQKEQSDPLDNDASFSSLVASPVSVRKPISERSTGSLSPSGSKSESGLNGHSSIGSLESNVSHKPWTLIDHGGGDGPDDLILKINNASTSSFGNNSSYHTTEKPPLPPFKKKKGNKVPTEVAPSRNISMGDAQPVVKPYKPSASSETASAPPIAEKEEGELEHTETEGTDHADEIIEVPNAIRETVDEGGHQADESKLSVLSLSSAQNSVSSTAPESMVEQLNSEPMVVTTKKMEPAATKKKSRSTKSVKRKDKKASAKTLTKEKKKPHRMKSAPSPESNAVEDTAAAEEEKSPVPREGVAKPMEDHVDPDASKSDEQAATEQNTPPKTEGTKENSDGGMIDAGPTLPIKKFIPDVAATSKEKPKKPPKSFSSLIRTYQDGKKKEPTSEEKEIKSLKREVKSFLAGKSITKERAAETPVSSPRKEDKGSMQMADGTPPRSESLFDGSKGRSIAPPPPVTKKSKLQRGKILVDDVLKPNKITADPHPGFAKIMGIWGERETKSHEGIPFSPLKPTKRKESTKHGAPVKLANVFGGSLEDDPTFKPPVFEKSEGEKSMIRQSFESNFAFSDLTPSELEPMVDAFEKVEYQKGETIAEKGDADCFFYVVQDGEVSFDVEGKNVAKGTAGDVFGELALVYSCDRATTVKAEEVAALLRLNQKNYRHIRKHQVEHSVSGRMRLLKKVHFFKDADETDLIQLASAMKPHIFKAKDDLTATFKEAPFCLIEEGSVTSSSSDSGSLFGPGGSFGEENLTRKGAGVSSVVAQTDGIACTIDRSSFEKVFGDMNRLALKSMDKNVLRQIRAVKAAKISVAQLDNLAQQIADQSFAAGEDIFVNNEDMVPALYIVRKGQVKTVRKNGKVDIIIAGDHFGQEYLMVSSKGSRDAVPSHVKAKYSAAATEDTVCGVLTLQECMSVFGDGAAKTNLETDRIVRLEDLERHRLLGEGHFGEVWLVTDSKLPPTKSEPYALKIQYLDDDEREAEHCINEEISIMKMLNFPFIVKLVNSYKEEESISMLLGLAPGGELFDQIHYQLPNGMWDSGIGEEKGRFYCSIIADTLSFMHVRGYVYRDLKPENVLIDKDGYPLITDFGFTKHVKKAEKTYTMCGTPNYLPPEIIKNIGHTISADNWSLGILIYEVVQGENPFFYEGLDQVSLFHAICDEPYYPLPEDTMSEEIQDLMDRLLEKNPSKRLGTYREKDILAHPWFADIDIRRLRKKEVKAPWVPEPIQIS